MQRLLLTTLLVLVGTLTMPGYALADDIDALRWCIDEDTCRSLEKKCEAGVGKHCHELSQLLSQSEILGVSAQTELRHRYNRRACDLEFHAACVELAVDALYDDPGQARSLLESACDAGDANGCHQLGVGLVNGAFGEKNLDRGYTLFESACASGNIAGCRSMTNAIYRGLGVKQDVTRAVEIQTKLCVDDENAKACAQLAGWYDDGHALEPDSELTRRYYELACKQGHEMSCRQIDDSICKTLEPCVERCDAGDAVACLQVGKAHKKGRILAQEADHALGADYLSKACEMGHGQACLGLVPMYLEHEGAGGPEMYPSVTPKDNTHVSKLKRRACELEIADACHDVAVGQEKQNKDDAALSGYEKTSSVR